MGTAPLRLLRAFLCGWARSARAWPGQLCAEERQDAIKRVGTAPLRLLRAFLCGWARSARAWPGQHCGNVLSLKYFDLLLYAHITILQTISDVFICYGWARLHRVSEILPYFNVVPNSRNFVEKCVSRTHLGLSIGKSRGFCLSATPTPPVPFTVRLAVAACN